MLVTPVRGAARDVVGELGPVRRAVQRRAERHREQRKFGIGAERLRARGGTAASRSASSRKSKCRIGPCLHARLGAAGLARSTHDADVQGRQPGVNRGDGPGRAVLVRRSTASRTSTRPPCCWLRTARSAPTTTSCSTTSRRIRPALYNMPASRSMRPATTSSTSICPDCRRCRSCRARGVRRRRHVRPGARPAPDPVGPGHRRRAGRVPDDRDRRDRVRLRRVVPARRRWKFRAVGQGYASGLAGLATDFGIDVAGEPPPAVPPPVPTPPVPPPPATAPFATGPTPTPPPPPRSVPADRTGRSGTATLDEGRVSLVKGSRVSLVKAGAPPLTTVMMGLGWDPARGRGTSIWTPRRSPSTRPAEAAMVWFTHLGEYHGALRHAGDNLTGKGEGDDEQIYVDLDRLPAEVMSIVFTITSFGGQKFTDIARAFCRLVDGGTGHELVRYELSDAQPHSAVIMAMLRRTAPAARGRCVRSASSTMPGPSRSWSTRRLAGRSCRRSCRAARTLALLHRGAVVEPGDLVVAVRAAGLPHVTVERLHLGPDDEFPRTW